MLRAVKTPCPGCGDNGDGYGLRRKANEVCDECKRNLLVARKVREEAAKPKAGKEPYLLPWHAPSYTPHRGSANREAPEERREELRALLERKTAGFFSTSAPYMVGELMRELVCQVAERPPRVSEEKTGRNITMGANWAGEQGGKPLQPVLPGVQTEAENPGLLEPRTAELFRLLHLELDRLVFNVAESAFQYGREIALQLATGDLTIPDWEAQVVERIHAPKGARR